MSAIMAGPAASERHEHNMRLVQVDYDDLGHSISEFECPQCGAVWFD